MNCEDVARLISEGEGGSFLPEGRWWEAGLAKGRFVQWPAIVAGHVGAWVRAGLGVGAALQPQGYFLPVRQEQPLAGGWEPTAHSRDVMSARHWAFLSCMWFNSVFSAARCLLPKDQTAATHRHQLPQRLGPHCTQGLGEEAGPRYKVQGSERFCVLGHEAAGHGGALGLGAEGTPSTKGDGRRSQDRGQESSGRSEGNGDRGERRARATGVVSPCKGPW